jgi:hypothetical protein
MTKRFTFERTLGAGAFICLLLVIVTTAGAIREANNCCRSGALERVTGAVENILFHTGSGGLFGELLGNDGIQIQIAGLKKALFFEQGWPQFDRIQGALQLGMPLAVSFANCRPYFSSKIRCDIFEISEPGRGALIPVGFVSIARQSWAERLVALSIIFGALGVLLGAGAFYSVSRRRVSPDTLVA